MIPGSRTRSQTRRSPWLRDPPNRQTDLLAFYPGNHHLFRSANLLESPLSDARLSKAESPRKITSAPCSYLTRWPPNVACRGPGTYPALRRYRDRGLDRLGPLVRKGTAMAERTIASGSVNRRQVVKAAACAAATVGPAIYVFGKEPPSGRVRIGLIGCGGGDGNSWR